MNNYLYLKGLRKIDHSVFCVEDGQKYYWDQQFNTKCAYSSGQQVKRSIIDAILSALNEEQAPITFNYQIEGNSLKSKEPWSPCNPSYTDQLLGGWMKAKGEEIIDEEKQGKEKESNVIKRRSPFSISAMRPLHPLLGGLEREKENITFDRSSNPNIHPAIVKEKDKKLSEEKVIEFLDKHNRTLTRRNWIPDHTRASGLFVYDVAIDLRTLFCISTNQHEPELSKKTIEDLKSNGWKISKNIFGECLVCPKERREKIISAISHGLINWRITSNQSRTFSLMETLAIAISTNANKLAYSIRAELSEQHERSAYPVIDFNSGAKLFITPSASAHIAGIEYKHDALEEAEKEIKQTLLAYDYENQVTKI